MDWLKSLLGIEERSQAGIPLTWHDPQRGGDPFKGNPVELVSAVNSAIGYVSRALSAVPWEVDDIYWKGALNRSWTTTAIRSLLLTGNSVNIVGPDRAVLKPVSGYTVWGNDTWRYLVDLPRPEGDIVQRWVLADGILHMRINVDQSEPWRGKSVFCGRLTELVESNLSGFAKMKPLRIISAAVDEHTGDKSVLETSTHDGYFHAKSSDYVRGGLFVESRSIANRGHEMAAQYRDVGFDPSTSAVQLRTDLVNEAWESCGILPGMRSDSLNGQAAKGLYAAWVDSWLRPLAELIGEQVSESLSTRCSLDVSTLKVPSVVDQSLVVSKLVQGGVELSQAKAIAGILDEG